MFAVVEFEQDNSLAVVSSDMLQGKMEVNEKVVVLWGRGKKEYAGIILTRPTEERKTAETSLKNLQMKKRSLAKFLEGEDETTSGAGIPNTAKNFQLKKKLRGEETETPSGRVQRIEEQNNQQRKRIAELEKENGKYISSLLIFHSLFGL